MSSAVNMRKVLITIVVVLTLCTYYSEREQEIPEQGVDRHNVTLRPSKENLEEKHIDSD